MTGAWGVEAAGQLPEGSRAAEATASGSPSSLFIFRWVNSACAERLVQLRVTGLPPAFASKLRSLASAAAVKGGSAASDEKEKREAQEVPTGKLVVLASPDFDPSDTNTFADSERVSPQREEVSLASLLALPLAAAAQGEAGAGDRSSLTLSFPAPPYSLGLFSFYVPSSLAAP